MWLYQGGNSNNKTTTANNNDKTEVEHGSPYLPRWSSHGRKKPPLAVVLGDVFVVRCCSCSCLTPKPGTVHTVVYSPILANNWISSSSKACWWTVWPARWVNLWPVPWVSVWPTRILTSDLLGGFVCSLLGGFVCSLLGVYHLAYSVN